MIGGENRKEPEFVLRKFGSAKASSSFLIFHCKEQALKMYVLVTIVVITLVAYGINNGTKDMGPGSKDSNVSASNALEAAVVAVVVTTNGVVPVDETTNDGHGTTNDVDMTIAMAWFRFEKNGGSENKKSLITALEQGLVAYESLAKTVPNLEVLIEDFEEFLARLKNPTRRFRN